MTAGAEIDPNRLASIADFGQADAERARAVGDRIFSQVRADAQPRRAQGGDALDLDAVLRAARRLNPFGAPSGAKRLRDDVDRLAAANRAEVSALLALADEAELAGRTLEARIEAARRTRDLWSQNATVLADALQRSQALTALDRRIAFLEGVGGGVDRCRALLARLLSTARLGQDEISLASQVAVPVSIRAAGLAALAKDGESAANLAQAIDAAAQDMIRSDLARLPGGAGPQARRRQVGRAPSSDLAALAEQARALVHLCGGGRP